jgi:sarcosine oxidase/L-pipecolate oxidase
MARPDDATLEHVNSVGAGFTDVPNIKDIFFHSISTLVIVIKLSIEVVRKHFEMSNTTSLFLVVGAGVFGASTALHLIRKYPSATVTIIDRAIPCQAGASWDWNKVVRADYTNVLYMKMALEAMELWRSEPMYKQFYHESGLVWVDNRGFPQKVIDNYKHLQTDEKVRMATPEEVRRLYGGIFEDAEFDEMPEILINESSGWVEANKALKEVIDAALSAGVKSIEMDITSLEFDGEGSCVGVRSASGQTFSAANVILATGARTAKLIADSAPSRADLQVGERFTAAAIFTGTVKVDAERAEVFRTAPVFLYALGQAQGMYSHRTRNLEPERLDRSYYPANYRERA